MLEWISHGIPIYHKKDFQKRKYPLNNNYFPENEIRQWANQTLEFIVTDLETTSIILETRLYLALLHSNSSKLRCNITSGLYFLSGRSHFLSR